MRRLRLLLVLLFTLAMSGAAVAQLPGLTAGGGGAEEPASSEATDVPALQDLLEVLKDDAARQDLIKALEAETAEGGGDQSATGDEAAAAEEAAADESLLATPTSAEVQGFARNAANLMVGFAADLRARVTSLQGDIGRLANLPQVLTPAKREMILETAPLLLLTIISTVAVYRFLRGVARRMVSAPTGHDPSLAEFTKIILLQGLLRAIGLFLAWGTGYVLAVIFATTLGDGEIAQEQALYLNGFLVVGCFTFLLGFVVSHSPRDVTFASLPMKIERMIFRSSKRVFAVLAYGVVTIVPIAQIWTNFVISRSLRSVIVTVGAVMALLAIRRIAKAMHAHLKEERAKEAARREREKDEETTEESISGLVTNTTESVWSRVWPWLAVAYVLTSYWVAMTSPKVMVEVVGRATAYSAGGLLLLLLSLRLMGAAGRLSLPVPGAVGQGLPKLGEKLERFLPLFAVALGLAGVFAAVALVLAGWNIAGLGTLLSEDRIWRFLSVLLVAAMTVLLWSGVSSWIDSRLNPTSPCRAVSARTRTLLSLGGNAFTIAVVVLGGMMGLAELGINIAPLLAGAGVIGLAIGFGAQKLVQDIITGVFIQLENAINEGDVVTVAGLTGGVESLTIRSVGIRDLSGTYHLIPFSAVDTVSNFMRRFAYHVENVGVAYDADLEVTRRAMEEAFDHVASGAHGHSILEPLEMMGVVSLADSAVVLRARIKTRPGDQWAVGRAYTEAVKLALDKHGVEIPFPHRELKLPPGLIESLRARNTSISGASGDGGTASIPAPDPRASQAPPDSDTD